MARTTPESLLVSAMINTQDPGAARTYGVLPEHLIGYRDELQWVLSYYANYSACPSQTELLTQFPDFPFSEDQTQVQWPAFDVKRQYANRDLTSRAALALRDLSAGRVEDAYAHLEGLQLELTSQKPKDVLIDHSYLDDYERGNEVRIPMPWGTLQNITEGMGPGELWYIAARQGQGKSTMMREIAVEAVMAGHSVNMYSLEMTRRQVQVGMHAALGRRLGFKVNAKDMLHRRFDHLEYKRIIQAIEDQVPGHMHIHDASMGRVTPAVVAGRAGEYDLTLVDYVGLMYTDDGTAAIKDYRGMAEISNQLSEIVQSKLGRIIGAAQINRDGDTYGLRPPGLKTLAQSDHLGNDAAVVLTMKRHGDGASVVSVEKNRFGPSRNLFFTRYDPNNGDLREISHDEADDIKDSSDD